MCPVPEQTNKHTSQHTYKPTNTEKSMRSYGNTADDDNGNGLDGVDHDIDKMKMMMVMMITVIMIMRRIRMTTVMMLM